MKPSKMDPIKPNPPEQEEHASTEPSFQELSFQELSFQEVAELRALLRDIYPDPPATLRENVMAKIHAETEARTAEARKREERLAAARKRRALIMKWGGMAACVTILCGALAIASPLLTKTYEVADEEAYALDTIAETMAEMPTEMCALTDSSDATTSGASGAVTEAGSTEAEATTVYRSMLMTAEVATEEAPEAEADAGYADEDAVTEATETAAMTTAAPVEEKSEKVAYGTANGLSGDPTRENMALVTPEQRASFLQWLFDTGLLDKEVYDAWMTEMGYTSPDHWHGTQLCEAFGLDVSLIADWQATQ